jgi:hypothetical protein
MGRERGDIGLAGPGGVVGEATLIFSLPVTRYEDGHDDEGNDMGLE